VRRKEITVNSFGNVKGLRDLVVAAVCAAAATGVALTAAAAAAGGGGDGPAVTVRFGDLDLSRPEGATALYRRIHFAAEQVCWLYDGWDLGPRFRKRSCMQRAIAEAVKKVNRPELYAVYNARNPTPPTNATATALRTAR
jgi:UrcA family protein